MAIFIQYKCTRPSILRVFKSLTDATWYFIHYVRINTPKKLDKVGQLFPRQINFLFFTLSEMDDCNPNFQWFT